MGQTLGHLLTILSQHALKLALSATAFCIFAEYCQLIILTMQFTFSTRFPVIVAWPSTHCMHAGMIDMHVHMTGGGGEAGPASRCPEAQVCASAVMLALGCNCFKQHCHDMTVSGCSSVTSWTQASLLLWESWEQTP